MPKAPRKSVRHIDVRRHARFLTFSCFARRPFLARDPFRQWTLDAIHRARTRHRFELWAYVIMPTHVHLLLVPPDESPSVSPILTSIKQPVANKAIRWAKANDSELLLAMTDSNHKHHLWLDGPGYDRNLFSPERIWNAIDYIHANPVEAGLCTRHDDCPYSSARAFSRNRSDVSPPIPVDIDRLPRRP